MIRVVLIWLAALLGTGGLAPTAAADDFPPPPDDAMMLECPSFEQMLLAQAPDSGPPMMGQRMGPNRGQFRRQMKHMEQLRILKMLELLNLDDKQEIPFLTAFNAMRNKQRGLDDQIDALLDTLAQGLRQNDMADARINELADRGLVLEESKHRIMFDFIGEARAVLTPTQFGKFIIFQKRFESHMLEQIGRLRQGTRPGGHDLLDGEG